MLACMTNPNPILPAVTAITARREARRRVAVLLGANAVAVAVLLGILVEALRWIPRDATLTIGG